jgi:pectate lyase
MELRECCNSFQSTGPNDDTTYLSSTTGGSGASVTTVTTLDELTAAVEGDEVKIILVDGTISGTAVVKVGSNTSILGNAGASK